MLYTVMLNLHLSDGAILNRNVWFTFVSYASKALNYIKQQLTHLNVCWKRARYFLWMSGCRWKNCNRYVVDRILCMMNVNCNGFFSFLPRCIKCRRGLAMRIFARPYVRPFVCLSVCLSVCQKRDLW